MPKKKKGLVRLTKRMQPRRGRCRVVAAARNQYMKNFGDYYQDIKKFDQLVKKVNSDDRLYNAARAKQKDRPRPTDIDKYAGQMRTHMHQTWSKLPKKLSHPMYVRIEDLMGIDHRCFPDIDYVSESWVYPGKQVLLRGNCFGRRRGSVVFKVGPNMAYIPPILSWSRTEIMVDYKEIIFPNNRPYRGRVWVIDADGYTSNALSIKVFPPYSWRSHTYIKWVTGIWGGASVDDTYLSGERINDKDFVVDVYLQHLQDGWSELRSPWASGQNLAQGYHIGVDWLKTAMMNLHYSLYGPFGIPSPPVAGVSWSEEVKIGLHVFEDLGFV